MSKLAVVTGNTGTGKTTFIQNLSKHFIRAVFFDINYEYGAFGQTFDRKDELLRFFRKK